MTDTSKDQPKQDQPKQKKRVAEILSVTFMARVGVAGTLDTDLELVTSKEVVITPETHPAFGGGVRLRWKNKPGFSRFVPAANLRDVNYAEREE